MGRSQHFDTLAERGLKYLEQHGVKGMRWGVRRKNIGTPREVVVKSNPGRKATARGGEGHPASEDAKRAVALAQRAKKSSTHSLDNKELQDLVTRLNLEKQYSSLTTSNKSSIATGKKFASGVLAGVAKQQVTRLANDAATKHVNAALKK